MRTQNSIRLTTFTLKSARSLGHKALLTGAAMAPFMAPSFSDVKAQNYDPDKPLVLWMETRQLSGAPTRHIMTNQGFGLIFYADNSFCSNLVSSIKFKVNPPSNVQYWGSDSLNPYIVNDFNLPIQITNITYIDPTNDFFYKAKFSVNTGDLVTERKITSDTQQSQLINQNKFGKFPILVQKYLGAETNLGTFTLSDLEARDIDNNNIPIVGTRLTVNIIDFNPTYDSLSVLRTNAPIILDMHRVGKLHAKSFFIEAQPPFSRTNYFLRETPQLFNGSQQIQKNDWPPIKESYKVGNVYFIGDFTDFSKDDKGFYGVTH